MATSFKIGYAFEPNKKTFITDAIVDASKQRGIDLIKIDTDKPLAEQGPFDCILQRLSNEIRIKQLEEYSSLHPDVLIIDPPSKVEVLHDRYSMLHCVEDMMKMNSQENEIGMPTFGIPKQVLVTDVDSLMNVNAEGGLKLRFPLIAKPEMVDGSMQSHELSLVYNLGALKKVHTPVVLQEFVNHGGVMFKVYIVGDYATCAKRNSLPDISEEQLDAEKSPVPFSQISNKPSQEHSDHMSNEERRIEEAVMPPDSFISRIASGLRQATGLHLMNFDLIRDSRISNHYLILDINYAPGFEKMPSYESVLTDFFCDLRHGKQNSLSGDMKKEEEE
ncbi:hypothetical protein MKW98_015811 [Papaver atlanticum]|uniref:Inositol-tetrakisphosphate 1-kinase n=1 Tax=Papaver atlanticum TaxID=357466 RepID=A0AAD4XVX5_9MAGN|nr:hypothetical protein MKW98_015811 [Papaver atlanticum]